MREIPALIAAFTVGVAVMAGASAIGRSTKDEPRPPVGNAEVSDLVSRLVPFVQDPSSEYSGVAVVYSGGGVSIRMRLKNRNEYNAKSATLAGAVQMLTAPSDEIKTALTGWRAQ